MELLCEQQFLDYVKLPFKNSISIYFSLEEKHFDALESLNIYSLTFYEEPKVTSRKICLKKVKILTIVFPNKQFQDFFSCNSIIKTLIIHGNIHKHQYPTTNSLQLFNIPSSKQFGQVFLDNLPPCITELHINSCDVGGKLDFLPESIKILCFLYCQNLYLENLPKSITNLFIKSKHYIFFSHYKNSLPPNLEFFHTNCIIDTEPFLPKTVNCLKWQKTGSLSITEMEEKIKKCNPTIKEVYCYYKN